MAQGSIGEPDKPDLALGVAASSIRESELFAGRIGENDVLLARVDGTVVAYGSRCPHLGAPLEKGACTGAVLRCPWHHARFDLRTGEAIAAPAFDNLTRWIVEKRGDRIVVTGAVDDKALQLRPFEGHSEPGILIVGGGAAGYAAAHELRKRGHEGAVTVITNEPHAPYDRTLLTKDYLDGKFGDERLPIARRSLEELGCLVVRNVVVQAIDRSAHHVQLSDGRHLSYTKLLLATGAEPNRLTMPGADLPHVHVLRSLADCRAVLAALTPGARVVVIGSSFIGLEAAASIRTRDHEVTVVTPEQTPMAKKLGEQLSRAILAKHTGKGVTFFTGANVKALTAQAVELDNGTRLPADLVVVGIGVKPRTGLAEAAGLRLDDGVVVDEHLATSDPDIFAAGDIARWPDPVSGRLIRVEHWVVAERHGQVAAANMLGAVERYRDVPFFWSKHFDFSFRYLGHAEDWDELAIDGELDTPKAVLRYRRGGRDLAVVTVGDDTAALQAAMALEASASHPADS